MNRRIIVLLAISMIGGVVLNLIALSACIATRYSTKPEVASDFDGEPFSVFTKWGGTFIAHTLFASSPPSPHWLPWSRRLNDRKRGWLINEEEAIGLPFRCVRCRMEYPKGGTIVSLKGAVGSHESRVIIYDDSTTHVQGSFNMPDHVVPYEPAWLGLLGDLVFWCGVSSTIVWYLVRRRARRISNHSRGVGAA